METSKNDITIECVQGDISDQSDIEAVVNAANAQLRTGGGVAGAIHNAAGPELAKECRPLAPIQPGEAVITGGHDLSNDHVIHCLGPVYGEDQPEDELLASCYRETLKLAEQHRISSIAFPAISTGAFGYPSEEAADITLETVTEQTGDLKSVNLIRFVLYGKSDYQLYKNRLKEL